MLGSTSGVTVRGVDSGEGIARYVNRNPGMSHVAVVNDTLIGVALCGHDGRRGYLQHVMVNAEFRNQGIGKRLVDKCLGALREAGIEKAHIDVLVENHEGIGFWERIGWKKRSDITRYSSNLTVDENA